MTSRKWLMALIVASMFAGGSSIVLHADGKTVLSGSTFALAPTAPVTTVLGTDGSNCGDNNGDDKGKGDDKNCHKGDNNGDDKQCHKSHGDDKANGEDKGKGDDKKGDEK